jgi:hypothetical protein
MTSGIYKLTFKSGRYYIGKSNDIVRRWKEHFKKMTEGKAAKAMQAEFDRQGHPEGEVLFECHADHLSLVEPIFIHNYWSDEILNTTREDFDPNLQEWHLPLLKYSVANMLDGNKINQDKIALLEQELEQQELDHIAEMKVIKNAQAFKELAVEFHKLAEKEEHLLKELSRVKNRGLLARIFNW